jgi:hypothetical protein
MVGGTGSAGQCLLQDSLCLRPPRHSQQQQLQQVPATAAKKQQQQQQQQAAAQQQQQQQQQLHASPPLCRGKLPFQSGARDSGLPAADVLASSTRTSRSRYAGTIAQVTTHHHHHALDAAPGFAWLRLASPATPGQRALVQDEELLPAALNRRATSDGQTGWDR